MSPRHRVQEQANRIKETAKPTGTIPRRVIAPYRPFPVEYLPAVLRESVLGTAKAVGCDPTFAALPALSLAGSAIGAALAVSPKRGYVEFPILWAVVVGDSGTAKSPAADPYATIALGIEDDLEARFLQADAKYGESLDEDREEMPKPIREYFTADDITIERLVENLNSSPAAFCCFKTSWRTGSGRSAVTEALAEGRMSRSG